MNVIKRYGKDINILGHLCNKQSTNFLSKDDIIEIVEAANALDIAMEINCANFVYGKTDLKKLKTMLDHAKRIYINSDAHTMNEFINLRKRVSELLKSRLYI